MSLKRHIAIVAAASSLLSAAAFGQTNSTSRPSGQNGQNNYDDTVQLSEFTVKGDAPYPARFVGGHGRGLKSLGLALEKGQEDDD